MVSAMFPFPQTIRAAGEPIRVQVTGVSSGFFAFFGASPTIGRDFSVDENRVGGPAVVMVTHAFWQDRLAGQTELDRIPLELFGQVVTVVGVVPPGFGYPGLGDVFFPHERQPGTIRSAHNYRVVGRLAEGVARERAQADMTAMARSMKQQFGDETQAADVRITPLREYITGDHARLLGMLLGAAGLVLLIACANLVSAVLARGAARRSELAVRSVLGAGRARLVRELATESLVLAVGGATIGMAMAFALLRGIQAAGAGMLPRLDEVALDARALAFAAGVTALTTILVGVLPAFAMSGTTDRYLRSRGGSPVFEGRPRVWHLLVGFEAALVVLLLVASGLLIRSLRNILTFDPGFDPRGVLTVSISPESEDEARLSGIETSLAALAGIESVGTINMLPLTWGIFSGPVLRPEDVPPSWPAYAGFRLVTPGYFSTMRMPILEGRAFTVDDRIGQPGVAIISRPLAEHLWPGEPAVGKLIRTNYLSQDWLNVVGIVPEATFWGWEPGVQNEIYTPLAQHPTQNAGSLNIVLRTRGDPASFTTVVRARLKEIAPDLPPVTRTMEERVASTARDRRFAMLVLIGFALAALLLAAVGIYGVVSYTTSLRTREIGVRVALGATAASVQRGIVYRTAAVAGAGIVAGTLAGLLATRALEGLLFGVERLDPATFAAGAAVLLIVALLAAWLPARWLSRIDPLVAMRHE